MPTQPDTETGWTKEFPTADGDYLCRINEHDLSPVSFRLENGAIYEYGCGKNLRSDYYHHATDYEFLGPFTWRDLEQLLRLRDSLRYSLNVITLMADQLDTWARQSREGGWSTHQVDPMRTKADVLRREATALREALAHTGEQS